MSIRLSGSGNVTDLHRLWRTEKQPQNIGSGVFVDGYVYRSNAESGKGLQCLDPTTDEIQWSQRTPAAAWGSIVKAENLLYFTGQDGTTIDFRPNPQEYQEISENELNESCNGTIAVSDGQVFIRTDKHLFCIAE
ncbi:MAG: PQQ-binding-like beta-propeller repeat protein [Pirellulales bacterium]